MQTHLTPGVVRRFEIGASALADSSFLTARGIRASYRGSGTFYVQRANGTYKTMNQAQFTAFIDAERVKAGLEPIRTPPAPVKRKRKVRA